MHPQLPLKPRKSLTREQTLEELVQAIEAQDSDPDSDYEHDDDDDDDDHDASFEDLDDPTIQFPKSPMSASLRDLSKQLTLNEVFLNLQDPGLRPRRINRLMQGLSPETPINSVLPTTKPPKSPRPPPFQGDGNWRSEAFKSVS